MDGWLVVRPTVMDGGQFFYFWIRMNRAQRVATWHTPVVLIPNPGGSFGADVASGSV